ncbi:hypothetical protein Pve01_84210 [Planomonospora venezuelensis]|nr:hypothetical protein Pve01_84210 [Planomonospora venezuelensis]
METAAADQVRVAEVGDDVPRGGVLAELLHGEQPRTSDKDRDVSSPGLAGRSPGCRVAVGVRE